MSYPLDWDTSLVKTAKQPPLQLGPIPGVLPYQGYRSPLSRSNTAHRISMALPTPATNGVPQVYHFESAREMAVAIEALLIPEFYKLEVQLPPIPYVNHRGKRSNHSFDLRITYRCGFREAVFVRNGTSLLRPETRADIEAIFEAAPANFADKKVVINGDGYTRAYRDNLLLVWEATKTPDEEFDKLVLDKARQTSFWDIKGLMAACDHECSRVFDAILRLIGRKKLGTNWHTAMSINNRVWVL